MAKAFFVKKARKPIYQFGKEVSYVSEKGKRKGQTIRKIDRTIPRDKDDVMIIKPGEPYYHWSFMHGGTHYSRTSPKRSQLTQSSFLASVYDLEDQINETSGITEGDVDSWLSEIESLKEECEERLDSMPEHLRDTSSSGQLLQERIDNLEQWMQDLEQIDFDIDEEELKDTASNEWDELSEEEKKELERDDWIEERFNELYSEKEEEIDNDVQNTCPGFS